MRSPEEVFMSHGRALVSEDLDAIVKNFAEDAVVITPAGVRRGRVGVREVFTRLFDELPNATWDLKIQTLSGDILFLEWSADSDRFRAEHGVDTFIFRNGLIQAQTVRYALMPGHAGPA
ncbi:nuclear transport factor 2 family protein [Streptomyces sp. NPDC096030]|uniref:nuclear transport factor 2 family protein n=1 Tax=Streptomyces sp. NPDC096030 TaxID=3155423 RepID=UPI0033187FAE